MSAVLDTCALLLLSSMEDGGKAINPAVLLEDGTWWWASLVLLLPLLSLLLCGLCAAIGNRTRLPAWITVGCLGGAFVTVLALFLQYTEPVVIPLMEWFTIAWRNGGGGSFQAAFALHVDQLTLLWMLFVTGLGTLITLYATEYMEDDVGRGYARFFAGVSVFLLAMSILVMGDNLLMLYLGWEGVGFASYWLIGYYTHRPSAVAAAKKAFIVNRIGDFGLLIGIFLIYHAFGTIRYAELFPLVQGQGAAAIIAGGWSVALIPYLLMLGAFGKSAQLPLFVWLPDAMEGPTPVSALIHAATMVTAGVYLLARMFPLMATLSPGSLVTVAWIGGLTAFIAATIGLAQYDMKRILAYSTVSQLGYMFMGLGLMTTWGAAYHVFTHAFFKAVLFLGCGAVMHGFAGQLDIRRLSGLRKIPGWGIVSLTMFYSSLCLAGFPLLSSGFFSKDMIMAEAFVAGGTGFIALGLLALLTALMTSYYAFRIWFRVFAGEVHYEMGGDLHGDDDGPGARHPRPPRLAMNAALILISIGAVGSIFLKDWTGGMIEGSSAAVGLPEAHGHVAEGSWNDPHRWMPVLAGITAIVGIAIAWWLHLWRRADADRCRVFLLSRRSVRWIPGLLENKWYVDEIYDACIRWPAWFLGKFLYVLDRYLIDFLIVDGIARLPRLVGRLFRPLQNGVLQSYAVSMVGGIGMVVFLILFMPDVLELLDRLLGGNP